MHRSIEEAAQRISLVPSDQAVACKALSPRSGLVTLLTHPPTSPQRQTFMAAAISPTAAKPCLLCARLPDVEARHRHAVGHHRLSTTLRFGRRNVSGASAVRTNRTLHGSLAVHRTATHRGSKQPVPAACMSVSGASVHATAVAFPPRAADGAASVLGPLRLLATPHISQRLERRDSNGRQSDSSAGIVGRRKAHTAYGVWVAPCAPV